jgi:hypothetical protein
VDHAVLENQDPDDNRVSISFDLALTAPAAAGGDGEGGRSVELEGAAELKGAAELEGAAPPEYLAPHPSDWDPLA